MHADEQRQRFSHILANIADALDISRTEYEEAVSRYEAVGSWLDADDSPLHTYRPTIYPQGSFRLGTMVKPLNNGDEYDIDLVCHLGIDKDKVTQCRLKEMVGERLKEHKTYAKMLDGEGRRCWTLLYANEFHMDVLPAIPDCERPSDCILVTDTKLRNWQYSNPKGYARWFNERMRVMFEKQRAALAESLRANVEDVPDYIVRTPLQRVVQLLKRHRDQHFNGDKHKPISVILTTLAAKFYENEGDVYAALVNIVSRMVVDHSLRDSTGRYFIPNPTNPNENFAEKWNEDDNPPKAFFSWLGKLQADLKEGVEERESSRLYESLSRGYGSRPVERAFDALGEPRVKNKAYPVVMFSSAPTKAWTRQ